MRILILIGLILIGFAIYTFLTSGATSIKPPVVTVHVPVKQELVESLPPPAEKKRVRIIEQAPEPDRYDTAEQIEAVAGDMGEMRHPERMYRPGPENTNTSIAAESGSAAMIGQMQQYRPELVQNGGSFMDNIVAAGADESGFSSFN